MPFRSEQVLGSIPSAGSKPLNKLVRFETRGGEIASGLHLGCSATRMLCFSLARQPHHRGFRSGTNALRGCARRRRSLGGA
jgi:hypothetical protein